MRLRNSDGEQAELLGVSGRPEAASAVEGGSATGITNLLRRTYAT